MNLNLDNYDFVICKHCNTVLYTIGDPGIENIICCYCRNDLKNVVVYRAFERNENIDGKYGEQK